jgi:hypothetical protein
MRLHVKLGGPSQAISESLWPRLRKEPDHDLRGMPRQSTSPLGHKRVAGDTVLTLCFGCHEEMHINERGG